MKQMPIQRRLASIVLIACMLIGGMAGCAPASQSPTQQESAAPTQATEQNAGPVDASPTETPFYPIVETPITVTVWASMHSNAAKAVTNYSEIEYYARMEELTNVKLEFLHPSIGQEKEAFNLMIASREIPDVVEQGWQQHYPGGSNGAFLDGYIEPLNEWLPYAPHLKQFMDENPKVVRGVYNDEGDILGYGQFRPVKTAAQGAIIREDWLKELNLPVPETVDEWEETLKAFKEAEDATAPLIGGRDIYANQTLSGAFGVKEGFMLNAEGKVVYGQLQPGFETFIALLGSWYDQGLLDPEFASNTGKTVDSKFADGQVGMYFGWLGGGFTNYLNMFKESDPDFSIIGLPYPTLNKGESRDFGYFYDYLMSIASISVDSKYKAEIMKYIDYAYTTQGIIENSFGYEGVTFNMVDGKPTLNDFVLKNPEGLPYTSVMSKYNRASLNGYSIYMDEYFRQVLSFRQQKDALDTWSRVNNDQVLPANLSFTADETGIISKYIPEIQTYNEEMLVAFIMGKEPMANFEAYRQQVIKMGVEEVIAVYQAAYDRYQSIR